MKALIDVMLGMGTLEVELRDDEVDEWVEIQRIESPSECKRALREWTEDHTDKWVDRGWREPDYEVEGIKFAETPELDEPESWYRKPSVDPGQLAWQWRGQ